jgi:5-methylcytosine-specific restriction endonuclease McrA
MARRTLILNADYTPLKVIGWKKAFMTVYKDAAYPIHYHDEFITDSKGRQHPVPSIIVLHDYKKFNGGLAKCTARNILIRDMYTCQYCQTQFDKKSLSVDHIIPRSYWHANKIKGSPTTFQNVVAACKACNRYKGSHLLGKARYPTTPKERWLAPLAGKKIELAAPPKAITYAELLRRQIQVVFHPYPDEWDAYLRK